MDGFTAVHVLCERMRTNPEDFRPSGPLYPYVKPLDMIADGQPAHALWMLTDSELHQLRDAYRTMHRVLFQQQLFRQLFRDPSGVKVTNRPPSDYLVEAIKSMTTDDASIPTAAQE